MKIKDYLKKSIFSLVVVSALGIGFNGCGGDDSAPTETIDTPTISDDTQDTAIGNIDRSYYGRWAYVDTAEIINIDESTNIDGAEVIDENQIKVTNDSYVRYLLRAGISNVKISGVIDSVGNETETRSARKLRYNNIAGIDIILKAIVEDNSKKNFYIKTTKDENQVGTTEDIISEDINIEEKIVYVKEPLADERITLPDNGAVSLPTGSTAITVEDSNKNNATFTVDVIGDEIDVGTLTVTNGDVKYNFKSTITHENDYQYFYDTTYSKNLEICNIGTADISGTSFIIEPENSEEFTNFTHNYNGSPVGLAANECKSYTIDFQPKQPTSDTTYKINITINDNFNTLSWNDYAAIKVSKHPSNKVYLTSQNTTLNGFLVVPGRQLIKVTFNNNDNYVRIPLELTHDYELAISTPDINNEDTYMISTSVAPDTIQMVGFTDVMKNEPDNNSSNATQITLENGEQIAYLAKNDIDFYKIEDIPRPIQNKQVNVSSAINIKFNTPLEETTITTDNLKIKDGDGNYISGTITYYSTNNVVTFNPENTLIVNNNYTIELGNSLKSFSGYGNDEVYSWTFTATENETIFSFIDGIEYGIIQSEFTDKRWLDRNLGATQVCSKSREEFDTDEEYISSQKKCFGDYYQWGRNTDGHEKKNSLTSLLIDSTISPIHDKFIIGGRGGDWTTVDESGIERKNNWNPCPTGFRVPTIDEFLRDSNIYDNLKLPKAGLRYGGSKSGGFPYEQGRTGFIWTNSTSDDHVSRSMSLTIYDSSASGCGDCSSRIDGEPVRCIKE